MIDGVLRLDGLTRRYRRVTALADFSAELGTGTFLGVAGPAGSGKSTLLRLLAGFERPDGGRAMLGGVDLAGIPVHRRGFGVVQQPDALVPHMTLAENIGYGLRLRGVKARPRGLLVDMMLELLRLVGVAGLRPARATPAQCQRAILARACVYEPRVLLLDDPFSRQDAREREGMMEALRRIHTMLGATILLATRDETEVLGLCASMAVLRGGHLVQMDTPAAIYDRPADGFVAGFLGETNRLNGTVDAIEDDIATIRLACGPQVEARCGPRLRVGDPCVLTLRPERIAVAPASAADMGEGALDASVADVQFLGDSYRLRLLIGSGVLLIVRRPVAAGLRGLSTGQHVAVAWQPYDALAFGA